MSSRPPLFPAAVIGAAAGFLSGLFGVGGGIVIVPGLVLFAGMEQRRAHATSLAAIVPIALAAVVGYALDDSVDWAAAGLLTAGAISGTVAGTRFLRRIPQRSLRVIFALFLLGSAALLPFEATSTKPLGDLDLVAGAALVGVGLLAGGLAGLLGVGGGIVMVPALVLVLAEPQVIAKGTSLAVIVPTAAAGTISNLRARLVDVRIAATVGLAGVLAAYGASLLALRLDPLLSAVLLALLLVAMAVRLLLAARGKPVPGEAATGN
ncbi:MAG: sulfite exporter TauE/SafE family protein [Actinomycetota bacterium]